MSAWLILRVFVGLPLQLEHTIRDMGISAYVPVQTIKRRHPRGKEIITQRKALLPGYCFVASHFDVAAINTSRTRARWLAFGNRLATITEDGIAALRASEGQWRPDLFDLAHVLAEIARGVPVKRHRFIRLSDFQQGAAA